MSESRAQGVHHIVLLNQLHDIVLIEETLVELPYALCDAALAHILLRNGHNIGTEFCRLVDEGRHYKEHHSRGHTKDSDQCCHDADYTVAQPATVLQETHQRIEHIRQQPGDEERQQYGTEVLDEQPDSNDEQYECHTADETVKCYLLFHRFSIFQLSEK